MSRSFRDWVKFWLAALFMPVSILVVGSLYMTSLQNKNMIAQFSADGFETLEIMRYVSDTEQYICNSINDIFNLNESPQVLKNSFEKFLDDNQIKCQFFLWDSYGAIAYSNFNHEKLTGDLQQAFFALNKIRLEPERSGIITAEEESNLRRLFGPHFFPSYYGNCFTGRFRELLRTDAGKNMPLLWMKVSEKAGLCVLFDYDILDSDYGVKTMLRNNKRNLILGYIDEDVVHCANARLRETVQAHMSDFKSGFNEMLEISDYRILVNYVSSRRINFCAVSPEMMQSEERLFWFNLARAIFVVVILLFTYFSFKVIVLNEKLSLKITAQLLLLFTVSNLLPGYVMLVICSDFLQQLRKSLVVQSFNESNFYLQKIDELFVSEYTQQRRQLKSAEKELRRFLTKGQVNRESIRGFVDQQNPEPRIMFLVASGSSMVAGHRGIVNRGEVVEAFFEEFFDAKEQINIMTSLQKLGEFFLRSFNDERLEKKLETEIEFIGESLFQKRPFELLKLFSGINYFGNWTLGKRNTPFYVEYFRLFDRKLIDYMMVFMWDLYALETRFLRRQFFNLNRNDMGLKIMAVDERIEISFPPQALQNEKIREIAFKLRDRNLTRPEYINYDNQIYLMTGYKCLNMMHMRLLAMYPLEKIEFAINEKWKMLLKFVLISLLISIFLGLSVAGSIIRPLIQLQTGVEALNARNFKYRLPDLGRDEFGHLAEIFNETLIDLEEMQTAKIVQEKLLVPMTEKLETKGYEIFGKTVSLSGMGGDYFEQFEQGENSHAFLLGDVAGRGVSTSLILAFVKSAVDQLHEMEAKKFMLELNRMLLESSRANQAKAFACQLLVVSQDGTVNIANAGLPFPMLVDHSTQSARQIEMPALPLGRTKKWRSEIVELKLEPGTSVVCFSSGFLYQWRVDYEEIEKMVLASIDRDVEKFCQSCFENFFKMVDRESCSQDVSILVAHRPATTCERDSTTT